MRRIDSFGVDDAMMIASLPVPRHVSIIFLDAKARLPDKMQRKKHAKKEALMVEPLDRSDAHMDGP